VSLVAGAAMAPPAAAGKVLDPGIGVTAAAFLSRILSARAEILPARLAELHLVAGFASFATFVALLPAFMMVRQPIVAGLRS
jgi:putative ABC transport system permease protein